MNSIKFYNSPILYFCGPLILSLIALNFTFTHIFSVYASTANVVVLFYIVLPFIVFYNIFLFSLYSINMGRTSLTFHGFNEWLNTGFIFFVWILISAFEIFAYPGIPLVNLAIGSGPTSYEQFGIPTLHGLANLLWIIIMMRVFVNNSSLFVKAVLAAWPILCLSRGLFIIMVVIFFAIHGSLIRKIKIRHVVGIVITVFLLYELFGYLGEIRSEFSLTAALGINDTDIAALWAYIYVTSPVANLSNTVDVISPTLNSIPEALLANFVPSVLKEAFGFQRGFDAYIGAPVTDFLNVGTAFRAPYLDWGLMGIISLVAIFAFISALARIKHRSNSLLLPYTNAIMSLNFFNNNFFSPTFLLLFFILLYTKPEAVNHRPPRGSVGARSLG